MNELEKLERRLEALGVQKHAYSLDGADKNEATILVSDGAGWLVYYSERGQRNGGRHFRSLKEACDEVWARLSSDPLSRVPLTNYLEHPPFRSPSLLRRLLGWLTGPGQ